MDINWETHYDASFDPSQAASIFDISVETIRTWRSRGFLPPKRNSYLSMFDVARIAVISRLTSGKTGTGMIDLPTAASAAECACRTIVYRLLRINPDTVQMLGMPEQVDLLEDMLNCDAERILLDEMGEDAPAPENLGKFMFQNREEEFTNVGEILADQSDFYWQFADSLTDLQEMTNMPVRLILDLDYFANEIAFFANDEPIMVFEIDYEGDATPTVRSWGPSNYYGPPTKVEVRVVPRRFGEGPHHDHHAG